MVKPRAKKAAKAQDNLPPIFVAEDLDPVTAARNHQIAEKAAQTHQIAAEKAKKDAETEYNNKLRCLEFEKMSTLKVVNEVPLHTDTPSTFAGHLTKESAWSIGMYVRVSSDFTAGANSFGGDGWLVKIEKIGRGVYVDIAYEEYCATRGETGVSIGRVTEMTPQK